MHSETVKMSFQNQMSELTPGNILAVNLSLKFSGSHVVEYNQHQNDRNTLNTRLGCCQMFDVFVSVQPILPVTQDRVEHYKWIHKYSLFHWRNFTPFIRNTHLNNDFSPFFVLQLSILQIPILYDKIIHFCYWRRSNDSHCNKQNKP